MNSKSAAFLAFLGTLLVAALMVWNLVADIMNVSQGLVPVATLLSCLIYAFGSLTVALFFYFFQKER